MVDSSHLSEEQKKQLLQITQDLFLLRPRYAIDTTSLTPINFQEEYDKFFKSDTYNPHYEYREISLPRIDNEIKSLIQNVEKSKLPEDIQLHLLGIVMDLDAMQKTKLSIGTPEFGQNADNLFDWGDDRLDLLLTNTPHVKFALNTKHVLKNAEEIKIDFEKALKSYGITELPVVVDEFSTHIISISRKGIKIGKKVKRYDCNVKRLIVHEIESHALQIVNVLRADNFLTNLVKYSTLSLYGEGLAVYNEIDTRKITPDAFDMYYNRIKAVQLLPLSFREIYNALSQTLPPPKAFVITFRVKRGMPDTSLPGGFPKDASYLLGYHEINKLIKEGFKPKLLYETRSPILTTLLLKYNLLEQRKWLTPKFI